MNAFFLCSFPLLPFLPQFSNGIFFMVHRMVNMVVTDLKLCLPWNWREKSSEHTVKHRLIYSIFCLCVCYQLVEWPIMPFFVGTQFICIGWNRSFVCCYCSICLNISAPFYGSVVRSGAVIVFWHSRSPHAEHFQINANDGFLCVCVGSPRAFFHWNFSFNSVANTNNEHRK